MPPGRHWRFVGLERHHAAVGHLGAMGAHPLEHLIGRVGGVHRGLRSASGECGGEQPRARTDLNDGRVGGKRDLTS